MPLLAYSRTSQSTLSDKRYVVRELLPFFRIPGVVRADTVGAELDIVSTTLPIKQCC